MSVDGVTIFSEVFNNAMGGGGTQSYVSPSGVELVRTVELGFRNKNLDDDDSGYDMGLDAVFDGIPHSSSSLTVAFFASGVNWQGNVDESFGLENVQVLLNSSETLDTVAEALPTIVFNDTDAEGQTLTVAEVNGSAANVGVPVSTDHGSVTVSSDGSFVYTYNGSPASSDSFNYVSTDGSREFEYGHGDHLHRRGTGTGQFRLRHQLARRC